MEVFDNVNQCDDHIFCFLLCEQVFLQNFFQSKTVNVLKNQVKGMIILKSIEGPNNKFAFLSYQEVELILKGFDPIVIVQPEN